MTFLTECQMSEALVDLVRPIIEGAHGLSLLEQVDGLIGRPDFLLMKQVGSRISYVVAVELKLKAWRRALSQAIKYRNFSNESYIILPDEHLGPALRKPHLFHNSGIGLASFDSVGGLRIHIHSRPYRPFSAQLSRRLIERYAPEECRATSKHFFERSVAGRRDFEMFGGLVVGNKIASPKVRLKDPV